MALNTILLALSKGLFISRTKLLAVESRAVLGIVVFQSLAYLFYFSTGKQALLSVMIMDIVLFTFMFWALNGQIALIREFIPTLDAMQQATVIKSFRRKKMVFQRLTAFLLSLLTCKSTLLLVDGFLLPFSHYISLMLHGIFRIATFL
jgi:signal transduction histidine kinase